MTGHTPGPWMAGPMVGESDTLWIGNGDGYVAQVTRIDGLEPIDWADARLISAAPEMLAALERAEGFISGFEDDDTQEGIAEMLAAIREIGRAHV